jgi:hypothetical protein
MKIDKRFLFGPLTTRAGDAEIAAGALKWALLLVNLPVFIISLLVMSAGEVGLILGGFFAFLSVLMFIMLFPGYLFLRFMQKHHERKESEATKAYRRKSRTHVGGDVYVHREAHAGGYFYDGKGKPISRDDPRVQEYTVDKTKEEGG